MSVLDTDVQVTHAGDGSPIAGRTLHSAKLDSVNIKDFGAVGNGLYVSLKTKFNDSLAAAKLAFPSVYLDHQDSLEESVDWAATQAALNTGKKVIVPKGDYRISQELEMITPGQVLSFENTGGYAYGLDALTKWTGNTRFIACGTLFRKVVRTRRKHRSSNMSPQDCAFSTVINVQAEGVVLDKVCIWLDSNYAADATTTSLGDANADVGIFVGTRCGFQAHDVQVLGYFRLAGIYLDVSSTYALPRFEARKGTPYAQGSTRNGGDGTHLHNPYILGARQGLAILGGKLAANSHEPDKYYDDVAGQIDDGRGSIGFSDFVVVGGQIYGPDHHSGQRFKDPAPDSTGLLSAVSLDSEPDHAPCAVHIDAISANISGGIWGLRFIGTRIASFEAFRLRLGRVDRLSLIDCHIDGRKTEVLNTAGTPVNTADYDHNSYGDIAGQAAIVISSDPLETDMVTGRVKVYGTARPEERPDLTALGPHFYGKTLHVVTDDGVSFVGGPISASKNKDLELQAWDGKQIVMKVNDADQVWVSGNGVRSLTALQLGNTSDLVIKSGSDLPEGFVSAKMGSLYLCTKTTGGGLYVKQSASGKTGWALK